MSKYENLWRYIKDCEKDSLTLTFEEIGSIAGVPLDHSFLRYKRELGSYGWEVSRISMKAQTVLFTKAGKEIWEKDQGGKTMKESICGANCAQCPSKEVCPGCAETKGCPFGKQCFVAKYILTGGMENWQAFKRGLIDEINALHIDGMESVTELYPLVGSFVNLEYPVPGGKVKFLKDDEVYLGAQVRNLLDDTGKTCFGVIARESFLLICTYGENGAAPELVLYKHR